MTGVRFALRGVTGETVDLTDEAEKILLATTPRVFGTGPVTVGERSLPLLSSGAVRQRARRSSWPLGVGIRVRGATQQEFVEQLERFATLINPEIGDVHLIATRPDGSRREWVGTATAWAGPPVESSETTTAASELIIRCHDPHLHDLDTQTVPLDFPGLTGSGLAATDWDADLPWDADIPWDGWEPTAEQGTVLASVDYRGTAPAWPRWEFDGPLDGITVANIAEGDGSRRVWEWEGALSTGETLVVETRELARSVRVGATNRVADMSLTRAEFWPLIHGPNEVIVSVGGLVDSNTAARMLYTNRWLTL